MRMSTKVQPSDIRSRIGDTQHPLAETESNATQAEQFVIRIGDSFEAAARGPTAIVCATIIIGLVAVVVLYLSHT